MGGVHTDSEAEQVLAQFTSALVAGGGLPGPVARDLIRMGYNWQAGVGGPSGYETEFCWQALDGLKRMMIDIGWDAFAWHEALASGALDLPVNWDYPAPVFPPGVRVLIRWLSTPEGIPSWLVEDLANVADHGWTCDADELTRYRDGGGSADWPVGMVVGGGAVTAEFAEAAVGAFLWGAVEVRAVYHAGDDPRSGVRKLPVPWIDERERWTIMPRPYTGAQVRAMAATDFGGLLPVYDDGPPADPAFLVHLERAWESAHDAALTWAGEHFRPHPARTVQVPLRPPADTLTEGPFQGYLIDG